MTPRKEKRMNDWKATGHLTRNPVTGTANNEKRTTYTQFGIAVNRDRKMEGEEQDADFFSCVAFGRTAEFIAKYFHKGDPILIRQAQIRNNNREVDGQMVYGTQVFVERVEFHGRQKTEQNQDGEPDDGTNGGWPDPGPDGFTDIPDGIDAEMPFT